MDINKGWIKLHRKLLVWEWYHDSHTLHLFIHCLFKANFEQKKWKGQIVERGSFITSLGHLSIETGIKLQTVRTCLERLELCGVLTRKSTNKNTIISIDKYDTYQDVNFETNTQTNKQLTNNQQTTNKQLTTTNNYKELKEEKELKELKEERGAPAHDYPTLQDVITKGAMIAVSEEICKAYFYNRDAVGWVNNKGHPIRNWNSDLMSFKLIYEQLNKNNQTEKINPNQKDGETYEQFIARVKRESQQIREIFQ